MVWLAGGLRHCLRKARTLAGSDLGEGLPLVVSLCHDLAWDFLEEGLLSDAEALVREKLVALCSLAQGDPGTFMPNVRAPVRTSRASCGRVPPR